MSTTPLPELERELEAAARRLDLAAAPRRRRWLHGWTLFAVLLASSGVGVAAAKVAGLDAFAYLDGASSSYPKLAPVAAITVQDRERDPQWQARANLTKDGQVCITGGPADTRTSTPTTPASGAGSDGVASTPAARTEATRAKASGAKSTPARPGRSQPPYAATTCSDSDTVAQLLVDPAFPGATYSGSTALNGHPDRGTVVWMDGPDGKRRKGRAMTVGLVDATRLLVFAVTAEDGPAPKVRFGAAGPLQSMRPSERTMLLKVDKSPAGLSAADQATVARFPDELSLRLWAGVLPLPRGTRMPQIASPDLPGAGGDGVIEVLPGADMVRQLNASTGDAKQRRRGIERFDPPVPRVSAGSKRWVGAFSRPRTSADAIPERAIGDMLRRQRLRAVDSRRLTTVGAGLGSAPAVWTAPGGMDAFLPDSSANDALCLVGAPVLGQCKIGTRRWKRPLVEVIVCSPRLDPKDTLVWGLTPPGATGLDVVGLGGSRRRLEARELVLLRRPQGERIQSLIWRWPSGKAVRVRVPWPKQASPQCGPGRKQWTDLRRDSEGTSASGHGGPWLRAPRG